MKILPIEILYMIQNRRKWAALQCEWSSIVLSLLILPKLGQDFLPCLVWTRSLMKENPKVARMEYFLSIVSIQIRLWLNKNTKILENLDPYTPLVNTSSNIFQHSVFSISQISCALGFYVQCPNLSSMFLVNCNSYLH